MKLAILSALPQELSRTTKYLNAEKDKSKHPFDVYRASYGSLDILLAVTGMGTARAESAAEYISQKFRPELVISIGYGGALYDGAAIGEIVWGTKFISVPEFDQVCLLSGEEDVFHKLSAEIRIKKGVILTLPGLINKAELLDSMPHTLLNPVCDMETFAFARNCIEKGTRFIALRSITDLKNENIPSELFCISDESGNYSIITATRIFISQPSLLAIAIRLGINSQKASNSLTRAVKELLKILKYT